MKTVARFVAVCFALAFVTSALATPVEDGTKASDAFLALADAQRYGETWDAASDFLKTSISRAGWIAQMKEQREPLGAVAARVLSEAKLETDPKGAPPGQYLLMTYETRFAKGVLVKTETLPFFLGADGRWRAVGYFVR
jgi:Protein of unknown function (DUF4019)